MRLKKRPRPRRYTIRDLADIATQLGCVVRFELIPKEFDFDMQTSGTFPALSTPTIKRKPGKKGR